MKNRKRPSHLINLFSAMSFLFASHFVSAAEVVLMGDSWAYQMAHRGIVQTVLTERGLGNVTVYNGGKAGSTAAQWNAGTGGVLLITDVLTANPDAELVHLIVGGNDLRLERPVPDTVIETEQVLEQLVSLTSAPIVFSGYDYTPEPPPGIDTPTANAIIDSYVAGMANAVANNPLLAPQVTVVNTHGLMQIEFGIPQLGIPAGDPSLPDAILPGPNTAFADNIHPNDDGYVVYVNYIFDEFYADVLNPTTQLPDQFATQPFGVNWTYTGWVNNAAYPWVWHFEQGWWYVCPLAEKSAWLWDLQAGWLYASEGYPWLYSVNRSCWLWYYEDPAAPADRWFTDACTGETFSLPKSQ